MKCMKCQKPVPIYFAVMLCDECIDRQIEQDKLRVAHQKLGEIGVIKGVPSVDELERMWELK